MALEDEKNEELGTGPPPEPTPDDGWKSDKSGKQFVNAKGRPGIIYRQGNESIEQARERDKRPRDKRPRKSKRPKMPDAPAKVDAKELERELTDIFCSPAMMCGAFGDEWGVGHFTNHGPILARNLVLAGEKNPWLRRKLEEFATGQDATLAMMSLVPVGGALIGYALPPVIYYLNLPAPERTRLMFGIPPRREKEPKPRPAPTARTAPHTTNSEPPIRAVPTQPPPAPSA
jgi:hypothetical protein